MSESFVLCSKTIICDIARVPTPPPPPPHFHHRRLSLPFVLVLWPSPFAPSLLPARRRPLLTPSLPQINFKMTGESRHNGKKRGGKRKLKALKGIFSFLAAALTAFSWLSEAEKGYKSHLHMVNFPLPFHFLPCRTIKRALPPSHYLPFNSL